jgi:hypothetical protein
VEVLVDGKRPLFKRTVLFIRKPDYKPALDVGSRDYRVIKKEKIFTLNGNDLVELNLRNKKKFVNAFGAQSEEVQQWMKEKSIDLSNLIEVMSVFEFLNAH